MFEIGEKPTHPHSRYFSEGALDLSRRVVQTDMIYVGLGIALLLSIKIK